MNQKSIKWTWAELLEMKEKIKLESKFVTESENYFDAQET